jgi:hypothetical protein
MIVLACISSYEIKVLDAAATVVEGNTEGTRQQQMYGDVQTELTPQTY